MHRLLMIFLIDQFFNSGVVHGEKGYISSSSLDIIYKENNMNIKISLKKL